MSSSRLQSVFTYRTVIGKSIYQYDIVVDMTGAMSARNIRGPKGLIADSSTAIPNEVLLDIQDALEAVALTVSANIVDSGTLSFEEDTEMSVSIATGLLNNTNYRVVYTAPNGLVLRTEAKTTTGFTAVAPTVVGTGDDPVEVDYAVMTSTVASSDLGGLLTFTAAHNGSKTVTFIAPLPTDAYRVLLSPSDFFPVKVTNKTKAGFTVVLGHSLGEDDTVTVGYDVVV